VLDQQLLRERYEKLDWPRQLGNLAFTLARISSRASASQYDDLTKNLLREAALFIEWSAPHTPSELLPDWAAMQRKVLAWQRAWPLDSARPLLALHARNASDRMLRLAGLKVTRRTDNFTSAGYDVSS
jgi:hypothetical protein